MRRTEFRAWLKRMDRSQRWFADRCGIHEGVVAKWINGERRTPNLLPVVCELLEAELTGVLGKDG